MEGHIDSIAEVIELPYGLTGRIFRSPMPFQGRDRDGALFRRFQELGTSVIVLLVSQLVRCAI